MFRKSLSIDYHGNILDFWRSQKSGEAKLFSVWSVCIWGFLCATAFWQLLKHSHKYFFNSEQVLLSLGKHWWEKLAKLWSSNPETISFPRLFLVTKFTTLTCALVHSISGKGPSWRPLPVGFSSSWPFWKYIETSTQDMFQTQIFHCVCIRCLIGWLFFPDFWGG